MEVITHSLKTHLAPHQIWKLWQDVPSWKEWDLDLEFSEIDGPFQTGTKGRTKFKETPALDTLLTRVEPMKCVVQEAYLPGAKVVSTQEIGEKDGMTTITFRVEIQGLAAALFYNKLERFIKKKVPVEMQTMLERAEHS